MNQSDVLEALLAKIRSDYKDDISFVVVHGSTVYGETHEKSDLDLYYLARTPRGNELAHVFILDGIGYDIWSIPPDRLRRIASHDERITSIITEGRLVYYGTEEDLRTFNELRARALDVSDRAKFLGKAQSVLDGVFKAWYLLVSGRDLYDVRMNAISIVRDVAYAIALVNGDTIKRGRAGLKSEILAMPLVPKDFVVSYDAIFETTDLETIRQSCSALIGNTMELIARERSRQSGPRTLRESMSGGYEEMINFYNKMRHACGVGDCVTALHAAAELQHEIEECFSGTGINARDLPDMIEAYDPRNLDAFLKVVDCHEATLIDLIRRNDIPVTEFTDINEVKRHISALGKTGQPESPR